MEDIFDEVIRILDEIIMESEEDEGDEIAQN